MRQRKLTLAGLSTGLVIVLAAATGSQATWVRAGTATATGSRQTPSTGGTVMLINGDRLMVRQGPDGRAAIVDRPGHDGLFSLRADGATEEIPGDALPYLGHGLAPSLFNVALLRRAEADGRLPVRVTFHGARPALPGVTVTSWDNGVAQGYLTAGSAGTFGAALTRQSRLDQASGRYGVDGLFGGNVSIALAGAGTAPARPAARSAGPKYTITVTGTNLSGKPDSGDVLYLVDAENVHNYYQGTFHDGSATFSEPASTYWVVAGFQSDGHQAMHMSVLSQFKVTRNTTVHTAARAATSAVTMTTPRPAKPYLTNFEVNLKGQHGKYYDIFGWGSFAPAKVWVNPLSVKQAVGKLWCYALEDLAGTAPGVTKYVYNADFADAPGTIPPQRYVVKAANLATITDEYYEDAKTHGGAVGGPGGFYYQAASSALFPLALPGKLIQYYSTGGTLVWSPSFVEILKGEVVTGGQGDLGLQSFRPGEHQVTDWNRYPLHPVPAYSAGGIGGDLEWTQPSALRAGNALTVSPFPFGDNVPGHIPGLVNPGTKSTVTYTIDQNGTKIASGTDGRSGIPPVTLSGKPSVVKFALDAAWNGRDYKLSKATQTVWTWHSAPDPTATVPHDWFCLRTVVHGKPVTVRRCAVQSMMTLDYQVNGMHLNGTVPAGTQTIGLSVGHIQLATAAAITGAAASASCNGGKTWQKAAVSSLGSGRYRLTFSETKDCDVTLRTTALDAAGGSIAETITDAYATAG